MKKILTIVALVVLVAPATVAAQPASSSKACKAQRNSIGMTAFRQLYAPTGTPKAAMDACVARDALLVSTETKNAAKACKAERGTTAESKTAFEENYGTNANKKNAFGKCVSQKTGDAVTEERADTTSAAKTCKAERGTTADSRAAFAEKYGNKRNAFGKCVSQKGETS
jgi:hypothetical protein